MTIHHIFPSCLSGAFHSSAALYYCIPMEKPCRSLIMNELIAFSKLQPSKQDGSSILMSWGALALHIFCFIFVIFPLLGTPTPRLWPSPKHEESLEVLSAVYKHTRPLTHTAASTAGQKVWWRPDLALITHPASESDQSLLWKCAGKRDIEIHWERERDI